MAVLTISRNLGSNGTKIAKAVSEKLGYRLVDKDFIGTILEEYGLVEFDEEYDHIPSIWERLDLEKIDRREMIVDMINRVIRALAKMDNVVILGRSGYLILSEFSNVFHARIHASISYRVAQIAEEKGVSLEEAKRIILQSDKVSANFVETFYGADWEDTSPFDLVINGEKVPADLVVNGISGAVQRLAEKEFDSAKTTASIEKDDTLRKAILEQFK